MKYKAIIYDIDGTLLDTLAMNFYPLIQIVKEELDKDISYDEALQYACYSGLKTMELLGIKDIEKTYARWVQYVNAYPGGARVYDGIDEVLKKVNIKQGIASSKRKEQYIIDFVSKGLDQYIDAVVLMEDTAFHKPDPQPLLLCLEKLQVEAKDAIYIGDNYSDYLAAKNAHMDFGYASWGASDLKDLKATYIFNKPLDILNIL